ncbi:MAG: permease [Deltaproteobacteria bacterium]|nr:permease [Deltaproteobacteria bacterium]
MATSGVCLSRLAYTGYTLFMDNPLTARLPIARTLREQLGSIRRVYLRGNRIVRRDDFAQYPETVLLLHGFFQTRNVWEVMEERLRYDGYGVFSFDLGGLLWRFNTRSIPDLSATIADKIEGICARYGLDRFHIIGHSKGGMIARHYVQHHGGDKRAKSLITLGSPHHGTPTAAVGVGLMAGGLISKSPFQMLPGSALIRMLKKDTFPPGIPITSVYSRHDLVCPWWCSVLRPRPGETSMENEEVTKVGHTALTYDPGVYKIIRDRLHDASEIWQERRQG